MNERLVSTAEFIARLAALCVGGGKRALPRSFRDRQILLKSALHALGPEEPHTEPEVNDALQDWLLTVGRSFEIDHVTMRRLLVDEGFLLRDAAGTAYRLNPAGSRGPGFERGVQGVDPMAAISEARDEAQARKRQWIAVKR